MYSFGTFSRNTEPRLNRTCFGRFFLIALINCIAASPLFSQTTLRPLSQLLSTEAPFSFPERLVVGPQHDLYVLDTSLSSLFAVDTQTGKTNRICGPEKLSSPSDLAVDRQDNLWVLSSLRSKISKLTRRCDVQTEIVSKGLPLRIATNSFGELVVLKGAGDNLFELYGSDGKFLRGFGQRFEYKNETTNAELSDGRIAPDSSGGFFFSFNYPPLIRHYGRNGNLIAEFQPESEVAIGPPNVTVRKLGNSIAVSPRYQILVLDMAVDRRGHLYLLLSGKNKVPALNEGTQKLKVLAGNGRVLRSVELENNFHSVAVGSRRVYLLRNKKPLRLDAYGVL